MLKFSHDGIAEDADLVSVWDRLAARFRRTAVYRIPVQRIHPTYSIVTYDESSDIELEAWERLKFLRNHNAMIEDNLSIVLKPFCHVTEPQNVGDGWDADCG